MTWNEYLETSFNTREEKLVVIYKVKPHLLSRQYLGLLEGFDKNSILREKLDSAFPGIGSAMQQWKDGILPSQLKQKGAIFI